MIFMAFIFGLDFAYFFVLQHCVKKVRMASIRASVRARCVLWGERVGFFPVCHGVKFATHVLLCRPDFTQTFVRYIR